MVFFKLTKVDEARREVWGRATEEVIDRSGEVFDYETSKPLFEKWSAGFAEATDGKSLGNIRSMHGHVAAGKVIHIDFDDVEKAIDIGTKIIDDNEWEKVLEGVHTGFSIGGKYVKKWKDKVLKATRYTADPNEISLVDSPCLQTAKFFDVVKADGSVIQKAFIERAGLEEEVAPEPEQVKKGMGNVSALAWLLKQLGYMVNDQADEAQREGDGSQIPAQLQAWLSSGAQILRDMTEEETAELVAAAGQNLVPEGFADAVVDATAQIVTPPEGLPVDDSMAMAAATEDLEKKGAKHSVVDAGRLQQIHDLLVAVHPHCCTGSGYEAPHDEGATSTGKAEASDDLQKADVLAKVEELQKQIEEKDSQLSKMAEDKEALEKRVTELEAMPTAPKGVQKVVPVQKGNEQPQADDPIAKAAAAGDVKAQIILAHRRPVPVQF